MSATDTAYRKAFEEQIYLPYRNGIYRLALRKSGSVTVAEDVVQEVFVRAFSSLATLDDPLRIREWLMRIAANVVADVFRGREIYTRHEEGIRQTAMQRTDNRVETLRDVLLAEIHALPEDLRETFLMSFEEGLASAEVARILNLAEGTVRWRLSEGRKALRAGLRARLHDVPELQEYGWITEG